jgi:hypothetical protein
MADDQPTPEQLEKHAQIVSALRAALVGNPPEVQGAALADVLGSWLAGHRCADEHVETVRSQLLKFHVSKAIAFMGAYDAEFLKMRKN